jgi:SOUL heme-binding protein
VLSARPTGVWHGLQVKESGQAVKTGVFYYAGYNSPMEQTDRHNEVWLLPADTPAIQANTGNRRLLL